MPVPLVCPVSKAPLSRDGNSLVEGGSGRRYPILAGIPILLPSDEERSRVLEAAWDCKESNPSPLTFYDRASNYEQFSRDSLASERSSIETLSRLAPAGPHLEIGIGRGVLQGIGEDYVALDYSFALLQSFISETHQRICATAESLPFPDASFSVIYSIAALEHVPDPERAFEESHRVLRPGGVIFLAPAWHCIQDNCEGIPVRPYAELTLGQKARKATLPIRRSLPWKALTVLPCRAARRAGWLLSGRPAAGLRFGRLRPDYSRFWMSDSDAVCRLDSHEGALFFHSRGYRVRRPGPRWWRQLLAGHGPLVAWKPG